jgi:hypothetical protein
MNTPYQINKMEVKTFYDITITPEDMKDILNAAKRSDPDIMKLKEAFQEYDLSMDPTYDLCVSYLHTLWNVLGDKSTCTTRNYIVTDILGFDGIYNYGYYQEEREVATMVVFNYGDKLNK